MSRFLWFTVYIYIYIYVCFVRVCRDTNVYVEKFLLNKTLRLLMRVEQKLWLSIFEVCLSAQFVFQSIERKNEKEPNCRNTHNVHKYNYYDIE